MDTHVRLAQLDFKPCRSVVDRHAALTVGANQKLMALFVRMLTPDLAGGNTGYDEISLGTKWELSLKISDRQVAPRVVHPGKLIDFHAPHARRRRLNLRSAGLRIDFDRIV